jgi:hypothetical protein
MSPYKVLFAACCEVNQRYCVVKGATTILKGIQFYQLN